MLYFFKYTLKKYIFFDPLVSILRGKTPATDNKQHVEIPGSLKYLSNFWGTLEMPLINCEINLILNWSED